MLRQTRLRGKIHKILPHNFVLVKRKVGIFEINLYYLNVAIALLPVKGASVVKFPLKPDKKTLIKLIGFITGKQA